MSYRITNVLTFKGDMKTIKLCLEVIKNDNLGVGSIDFNKIIHIPENMKQTLEPAATGDFISDTETSESRWFALWSHEYWGVKCNAFYAEEFDVNNNYNDDIDDKASSIEFNTVGGIPIPITKALSEMFPDLEIEHLFFDKSYNFAGSLTCKNGSFIGQESPVNERQIFEFVCHKYYHQTPEEMGAVLNMLGNSYIDTSRFYVPCHFSCGDVTVDGLTTPRWYMYKYNIPETMMLYNVRYDGFGRTVGVDTIELPSDSGNTHCLSFMAMENSIDLEYVNSHADQIRIVMDNTRIIKPISLGEFINAHPLK